MLTNTPTARIIEEEIRVLLADTLDDDPIGLDDRFGDLGLNSLMLARLVIALEDETGLDPFSGDTSIVDVHTVGDLVGAYERALASQDEQPEPTEDAS
jgi:acyl carrier protein